MRSGPLDRRVTIQSRSESVTDSGFVSVGWTDVATRVPAQARPISSNERLSGPEFVATLQYEFRVRWRADFARLNARHRVLLPPPNLNDTAAGAYTIFDVQRVEEIGRREGLRIVATCRPDDASTVSVT